MGNLTQAKEIIGLPNSTLVKTALNATGSAPIYACRAWVNFNGTGTVAIRASGNVSSITDNGVGSYGVNFTTVMPDANYSILLTVSEGTGESDFGTTTAIQILTRYPGAVSAVDQEYVSVQVVR